VKEEHEFQGLKTKYSGKCWA